MAAKRMVYADHAATTPLSEKALEAMLPWLKDSYGNPSAVYKKGREARRAVEHARKQIAAAIGGEPGEIAFTSGGTEADNWAVKAAARMAGTQGKRHIVTTAIEHPAVLASVKALEQEGFSATYVGVDQNGIVSPEAIAAAIGEDTGLVSVMYANNEIGTIQQIRKIGGICRERGVLFHTDAVQAVGNIPVNAGEDNVDLLSLSGHKLYGPKGIGVLYIRKGIALPPYLDGGGQERGRRAGTENVAAIVGLGAAIEEASQTLTQNAVAITSLRDRLLTGLLTLPGTALNGSLEYRLPGNINIAFDGIQGESLLLMLDLAGVAASSASACSAGTNEPSHVLRALGHTEQQADSSLRLTLGHQNTEADVEYLLEEIPSIVEKLRRTIGWQVK